MFTMNGNSLTEVSMLIYQVLHTEYRDRSRH
jgi:hypothetical protein